MIKYRHSLVLASVHDGLNLYKQQFVEGIFNHFRGGFSWGFSLPEAKIVSQLSFKFLDETQIQFATRATMQYFHVVMFIMLYKVHNSYWPCYLWLNTKYIFSLNLRLAYEIE